MRLSSHLLLLCIFFVSSVVCQASPTITSISPTTVAPGMQMTLTGSGFGTQAEDVMFLPTSGGHIEVASFASWSDTQIVLTVPNGVSPGNVEVQQGANNSNLVSYTTIVPTLTSPRVLRPECR